jgi:CRISPR-associated protein Cmr3
VIEAMLAEPEPKKSERYPTAYTRKARTGEEWSWSDEEWALSYLSALNPCRADDYEDWLEVGMALHSVGDSLLSEWDNWSRQSCKYTPGCCEKKWKSFKRQGVAMGTLAHKAKQDGWRSPFEKASGQRNFGSGSGSGGDGGDALTVLSLRDRVLQILNRNQDRSQREEAFINLAQTTHLTTREIKELAASLETEVDLEESRSDRKAEIENLLKIGKYQLELQDYLDSSVACPLERVAGWMGTTSAAMLATLYPVIGSLLQVGTRLELIKATDFYALPIVYTGLVCESGGGKSPAQKTIINPLFALQDEAEIKYKERLLQYQKELTEWKKIKDNEEPPPEQPVPREYYTTDATSEAIALIQSQQPNHGFLGWFDELPALFKSQGQYKNGRGADGEKILSGRDGTGFKVNRASGKRLVVSQSAYSITGSLQPLILRQMMGDFTDANGQWARFLWTVMQVQPAPYPDDAIPFDVFGLLKGIYRRISKLAPQTYKLSPEAQKKYRNWYNKLDQLKMSESRQGLRAVYSKMKGDTGVLALLLHCFNGCVLEGSVPNPEVSEQTMAAAIKLAKYHIGQVKLIHSEGDVANGDIAAIHAKIIQLSERKGWLKAADVRDIDRQTKKQFTADDIRRHFQELETSGFGQTKGEGTRLMWSIYKDSPPEGNPPILRTDSGQTQDKPESTADISVQPLIGKILDKTQDNSGQTQDSQSVAGSISNISVQPLLDKTQDTQDTFEPANTNMDEPVGQKQIKSDVLSFSVLSCPELVSKSCDSITVGVSAQNKTQDNCPETVLSCPELEEGVKEVIAVAEAKLPIYQRSDGGFEVELGSLKGWEEALAKNPYPHVDLETAKANSLAMREVFTNGNSGDFQDLFELYSDKEINWVCAWLHDYQPTLHARIVRISAD